MWPILYNLLIYPLVFLLAHLVAFHSPKIRASVRGKKTTWNCLPKALEKRNPDSRLIWFHAPSAGEFIQLQPLLETFLKNDFDCIVTFNSISAEKWIAKSNIEAPRQPLLFGYLPFDSRRMMKRWINIIKPDVLLFIKYDLWPNAIWEADKAGIPTYLVSATLNQKTKRYVSLIGRSFYRDLYSHFTGIFAVEETDRQRFLRTNPSLKNVEVLGDIRFDATLDQRSRKSAPALPDYVSNKSVFILGSSWPPDEACVFPALKEALNRYEDLLLIVAPHEPTEKHLLNSEQFFNDMTLCRLSRLKQKDQSEVRVILVDSVGVLSAIYQVGLMAYIGGGFTTGVHNVMEPSAMGLPVFFGPIHYNSGEALQLAKNGLAFPVNEAGEFREKLFELLSDPPLITQLGNKAREYVESQSGATARCFQAIVKSLPRKT